MVDTIGIDRTVRNWVEGILRTLPVPCPRCSRKSKAEHKCPYCRVEWTGKEYEHRKEQKLHLKNETIAYMIVDFLSKQEWPSTTEDIAKAISVTWHTAQIHLFKLQADGVIKYRKVGRQNQWWLTEKYRKEFGRDNQND